MSLILGIESSCDETAASVTLDGRKVLSDVIYSQADLHKKYGGVVPEIASRKHIEKISAVVKSALEEADVTPEQLDGIAVTAGPGLIGALLAGLSFAKGYAYALGKPLIPVNHIFGHISANYIEYPELEPPFLCLVASGGHSHVMYVEDYDKVKVIGATTDDAAGEAFDKVARVLGLGYPGGPVLSKHAAEGNPEAIRFPRSVSGNDISFSGLKTAVINYLHKEEQGCREVNTHDVAASFEAAAVDTLCMAVEKGMAASGAKKVALAGGVAANKRLREQLAQLCKKRGAEFYVPPMRWCTDNAAMISCAGYYAFKKGTVAELDQNAVATVNF